MGFVILLLHDGRPVALRVTCAFLLAVTIGALVHIFSFIRNARTLAVERFERKKQFDELLVEMNGEVEPDTVEPAPDESSLPHQFPPLVLDEHRETKPEMPRHIDDLRLDAEARERVVQALGVLPHLLRPVHGCPVCRRRRWRSPRTM